MLAKTSTFKRSIGWTSSLRSAALFPSRSCLGASGPGAFAGASNGCCCRSDLNMFRPRRLGASRPRSGSVTFCWERVMPDLAESEFLTGGIAHYLEAQQAIHAFNEAMLERLDRYRRGRSWGLLQDVGFERNQVAGGPENGWWISTGVRGRTARFPTVRIDFGMWFGIPERPEPILYIGFFEEPKELL